MAIPMEYLHINCLVVDDESSMRKTISNMLTRMGFKSIITAVDGKEALTIIQTSKIDLVICDINMPEIPEIDIEHIKIIKPLLV